MAESIQPDPLADPSMFPTFRALLPGRRRRQVRAVIRAANLPKDIAVLLSRVVPRTKLWRREQLAVARELIAHFHDGLIAGESSQSLVEHFGDPRKAARLIRRAKMRNRPLLWHILRYATRGLLILFAIMAVLFVRFWLGRPTIRVDYVAQLNRPILAVPEQDRAWPIYRQALLALGLGKQEDPALSKWYGKDPESSDAKQLEDLKPTDADWPTAAAWIDAHADGFRQLRLAAAKPHFGFVLGESGSERDPELGWNFQNDSNTPALKGSVFTILLPALNHLRETANLLKLDLRYAQTQHDAARALADIDAMLGLAAQQEDPILVSRLVAIGIDSMAIDEAKRLLISEPSFFSDAQLVALAHRVSRVGGDTPASLIDLSAERIGFHDLVQRSYTDDGHGDGVITPQGARLWRDVFSINGHWRDDGFKSADVFAIAGAMSLVGSRRELLAEFDRLINLEQTRYDHPLRQTSGPDSPADQVFARLQEIRSSVFLQSKFLPIVWLFPSLDHAAWSAERVLGAREGMEIGIALELHRRRHGSYPAALSELAPMLLPTVPVDRITGGPLKYRLVDNHPVVYSVGVDHDDDSGKMAEYSPGHADPVVAAQWNFADDIQKKYDGDWILYDARPAAATTQLTQ